MRHIALVASLAVVGLATVSQAAFIVEPLSGGKGFANFTGTPVPPPSAAPPPA
jgi:hypothetical protein